ncbi:integrin alpha-PS2 [Caerostris extrusa]|uniref:Integrin alpha-PS2 n=1 Tax=Caerostris extrusa TaxID=172846 RepID=A0AAV4V6C6_CAEEX|nr:integrin alpha-PS2 [Caerostris extrusa]
MLSFNLLSKSFFRFTHRFVQLRQRYISQIPPCNTDNRQSENKSRENQLGREKSSTSCKLYDGAIVSCVVVSFCLEFTGYGIPPSLGFMYRMRLDVENQASRVFFLTDENQNEQNVSVHLRKESRYCKSIYVYLQNNVRDKLTPITVEVTYHLYDPFPDLLELKPILNQNRPNNLTKQINIQKNCGKDNICIPDVKIQVFPNMKEFLIGSQKGWN